MVKEVLPLDLMSSRGVKILMTPMHLTPLVQSSLSDGDNHRCILPPSFGGLVQGPGFGCGADNARHASFRRQNDA